MPAEEITYETLKKAIGKPEAGRAGLGPWGGTQVYAAWSAASQVGFSTEEAMAASKFITTPKAAVKSPALLRAAGASSGRQPLLC